MFDLGSGDGRLPILAAQLHGARGVGVEIDPKLVAIARANAAEAGVGDRVQFIEGDLFAADVSAATVVTLYLSTSLMRQIEPKLRSELRPGARIVSHQFWFQGWPADRTLRVDAFPDLTDVQVQVLVEAPGLSPVEVERLARLGQDVVIYDIFRNVASVRATMSRWIDYMHIAKWNGRWVIVNVLWELKA